MLVPLKSRRRQPRRYSGRIAPRRTPRVEILEDRTLLSTLPLTFTNGVARASDFLAASSDYRVYELDPATPNGTLTVAVDAQQMGSGLNSYLRIFDNQGPGGTLRQIAANDDFEGTDSRVTFQTVAGATYYVGVSASGTGSYNPTAAPNLANASILLGATHGLYQLTVTQTPGLTTGLTVAAFNVVEDVASPDDPALQVLHISYRLENRSGLAVANVVPTLEVSADNRFSGVLQQLNLPAVSLGAGASVTGTATITLPAGKYGTLYVGMALPWGAGFHVRNTDWDSVDVFSPTAASPGHAAGSPADVPLNALTAATALSNGTADYYRITLTQNGLLTARVQNIDGGTTLALLRTDGTVLVQTNGTAGADEVIAQHLAGPGTYLLRVSAPSGAPHYRLATEFTAAFDPMAALTPGAINQTQLIAADFTGDGIPDLVEAIGDDRGFHLGNGYPNGVLVMPGLGDGSFGSPVVTDLHLIPQSQNGFGVMRSADFNNDGIADLAIFDAPLTPGTVNILLGQGDGRFTLMPFTLTLSVPMLAVGDVNHDGKADLIVGNEASAGDGTLSVYFGDGAGGFAAQSVVTAVNGVFAAALAAGDFNNDGQLDFTAGSGTVLLGHGDGTFTQVEDRDILNNQSADIAVRDLDGDGNLDLVETPGNVSAAGTFTQGYITVSYGHGDGTFDVPDKHTTATGYPLRIVVTDLNGDGRWDVLYVSGSSLDVLLGAGTAPGQTLGPEGRYALPLNGQQGGNNPTVSDFNGDGRVDVATILVNTVSSVTVVLGSGDGTLQTASQPQLGSGTVALAAGSFRNNGLDDLVGADVAAGALFVGLSTGTGLIQIPTGYPFSDPSLGLLQPSLVVTGDFNGDGRTDLAAYYATAPAPTVGGFVVGTIAIFRGLGDGSFQLGTSFAVTEPTKGSIDNLFAADFNRDGKTDLALGQAVYLGSPVGQSATFTRQPFDLPGVVRAVGDFNGDGSPDLIVDVAGKEPILRGLGDGTFTPFKLPDSADSILPKSGQTVVGDFNGDGIQDVAVNISTSETFKGQIFVYLGKGTGGVGNGTVDTINVYSIIAPPAPEPNLPVFGTNSFRTMVVADFNHDGRDELAVVMETRHFFFNLRPIVMGINVYQLTGSGFTQTSQAALPSSLTIVSPAVGDFNGDGRLDIAAISKESSGNDDQLTVLLGRGDASFVDATTVAQATPQAVPLLADINGDRATDAVVLNSTGDILFRAGTPGAPGVFGPPIVVNPGTPARDVALLSATVNGKTTVRLAAVDVNDDQISIYTLGADGTFQRSAGPATDLLPTRIASADLNGDGLGDLVVITSGTGVSVFLATSATTFAPVPQKLSVSGSSGPFELALANVDNARGLDIVATNAVSGDVSVFLNKGNGLFDAETRFRAGTGPFSLGTSSGVVDVASRATTTDLTLGDFDNNHTLDVVVLNRDANTFSFLAGNGDGTLADARTFQAGSRPSQVVAGNFNSDGNLDLAILNEGDSTISVYLGDGHGNFFPSVTVSAGNVPTGLTVADMNGDGKPDLVVGNSFGDILILLGNGDGTFRSFVRADQAVPFVTTDLNHDGRPDVILANQALDQALAKIRQAGTTSFSAGSFSQQGNGLLGPGAVTLADVDGRNGTDIVIANSGSNDILVFLRRSDGNFDATPLSFFAGTNPVSITTVDLNHDGILDIAVANRSSNDVSILFGAGTLQADGSVTDWTLNPGPRLAAGLAPIGVTFQDRNKDGIPDMVVTNAQKDASGHNLTILPGIGQGGFGTGFFQDNNATFLSLPGNPLQGLLNGMVLTTAGIFDAFSGTALFAANNITSFTTMNLFGQTALVAGFEDGTLGLLAEDSGRFIEALVFRDAALTDPSALQVVNVNGQSEIYATSAGESRVFVFALSSGELFSGFGDRSQTANVQAVTDAGVALLAALVTGNDTLIAGEGGDLGFVVGLGDSATAHAGVVALVTTALVGADGSNEVTEAPAGGGNTSGGGSDGAKMPATLNGFIGGVEDAIRLFKKRIAGADADGGAKPQGDGEVDEVPEQASTPAPIRAAASTFAALDAVMRSVTIAPADSNGIDGSGLGLGEFLEAAVRGTWAAADSVSAGSVPPALADHRPPPLAGDRLLGPAHLAAALMLGGLWRRGEESRAIDTACRPTPRQRRTP